MTMTASAVMVINPIAAVAVMPQPRGVYTATSPPATKPPKPS